MTKKVLMLAAKANMIQQFNHRNIKILQSLGFEVHVATNMIDFGSMSNQENERFKQWMSENNVVPHQIDFERRMGSIKGNFRSIKQLRLLFKQNHFAFVHAHSPLGGILGRFVAWQYKVPTVYTAHGFHFFKDGSKSSWFVFFPIEWIFSFVTDTLITINEEDYALVQKYMHAKNLLNLNGNGVDVEQAWLISDDQKNKARSEIRKELNIPEDAFLITSVGELSDRKNHRIVLEALKLMTPEERKNVYYVIAGTGSNGPLLLEIAESFQFQNSLKLLGYRNDIHNINYASDLFVFPSLQEGLGIAGLDATVDGTLILGANRRGIADYIIPGLNGDIFNPESSENLKLKLLEFINNRAQIQESSFLKKFDKKYIDREMKSVYRRYDR